MHHGGPGRNDATSLSLNEHLVRTVPDAAGVVLQVGAAHGWLATALKARHPARLVYGAHAPGTPGAAPADDLDELFELDLERDDPPLPVGSVDCIVYADELARLGDPVAVLDRHRRLLAPSGTVCASVPNLQHHSEVTQLLRGIFQYRAGSLVDPSYRRLFTFAGAMQAFLDAGYAPDTVGRIQDSDDADAAQAVVTAGAALFELLGVGSADAERDLTTTHMLVRGLPLPDVEETQDTPITFVACVNDEAQLQANLLSSPCLRDPSPHEVLLFRGCANAAEGLNAGIEQARHELVVLVHQDVYLPAGWPRRLVAQWRLARGQGGPIGISGVFGVLDRSVPFDAIGRVVHRDRLLTHRSLPADVDGLDELLMVVPRDTALRVDPDLGWHLYGTDLCLQAGRTGLRVVVLDAPCHHNSLTGRVPWKYRDSERVLARKWHDRLPVHTNLSSIDTWLLTEAAPEAAPQAAFEGDGAPDPTQPAAIADLVTRLRREQVALGMELEQARLQVASMRASPFWRAREVFASLREKVRGSR
jgi:hypothetical protein